MGGKGQRGVMGGGEEGTYQNQGTFARCLFPPSGVCKLFFLCECACVEHPCVCVGTCVHGCVCASMFSGEGGWGGGFCNIFCRKRTQMTFNWQRVSMWGGIAGVCLLIAASPGWRLGSQLQRQSWGGRVGKLALAEGREGFGDQQ